MFQVILIRPGATDYDQQGRIQGVLDIPLNDDGASEVARVTTELRGKGMAVLYHSECESAAQTAKSIGAALDVKVKKLSHMQNLNQGLWQGMLVDEVKRKHPRIYRQWQDHPESICPPEGETLTAARERVQQSLGKLLKKRRDGVVGLVVPEPLASLVRAYLSQKELGDLWRAGAIHGTWELIDVGPDRLATAGK